MAKQSLKTITTKAEILYDEDTASFVKLPFGTRNIPSQLDNVLAVSSRIQIPQASEEFKHFQPGHDQKIKPVLELSGIKTMFKKTFFIVPHAKSTMQNPDEKTSHNKHEFPIYTN